MAKKFSATILPGAQKRANNVLKASKAHDADIKAKRSESDPRSRTNVNAQRTNIIGDRARLYAFARASGKYERTDRVRICAK